MLAVPGLLWGYFYCHDWSWFLMTPSMTSRACKVWFFQRNPRRMKAPMWEPWRKA